MWRHPLPVCAIAKFMWYLDDKSRRLSGDPPFTRKPRWRRARGREEKPPDGAGANRVGRRLGAGGADRSHDISHSVLEQGSSSHDRTRTILNPAGMRNARRPDDAENPLRRRISCATKRKAGNRLKTTELFGIGSRELEGQSTRTPIQTS